MYSWWWFLQPFLWISSSHFNWAWPGHHMPQFWQFISFPPVPPTLTLTTLTFCRSHISFPKSQLSLWLPVPFRGCYLCMASEAGSGPTVWLSVSGPQSHQLFWPSSAHCHNVSAPALPLYSQVPWLLSASILLVLLPGQPQLDFPSLVLFKSQFKCQLQATEASSLWAWDPLSQAFEIDFLACPL